MLGLSVSRPKRRDSPFPSPSWLVRCRLRIFRAPARLSRKVLLAASLQAGRWSCLTRSLANGLQTLPSNHLLSAKLSGKKELLIQPALLSKGASEKVNRKNSLAPLNIHFEQLNLVRSFNGTTLYTRKADLC